jgi:hypothetical protein
MIDLSILEARLQEAETAYHQLMTGSKAVTVSIGGYGSTTYTSAEASKLNAYIHSLHAQINMLTQKPRRGVIKVSF